MVIKRPPISRRQLHLMLPSKGGLRRKYGGTVTRHGIRKGDFSRLKKPNKSFMDGVLVIPSNKSQFPISTGKDWDNLLPRKSCCSNALRG